MSDGFQANTLTFSLKNRTSAFSYLGSRFDPISAVLLESPSTSWISLYSLDLIDFHGASSSRISSWSARRVHYNPSVGINIILEELARTLYLDTSLTPSQKLLQGPSGFILESHRVLRTVPVRIKNSGICLDFHIFDIPEIPLLIGRPIMRLLQEQPLRGQLDLKVGNSTIVVPLARSINTIVEPKPKPDPIEEVLMVS
jgi:hypothetical protein